MSNQDGGLERLMLLEELAQLTRLDDLQRQAHRHGQLAQLGEWEAAARLLTAGPGPLIRAGKVVTGDGGQPVPDPVVRRQAGKVLERAGRERAALGG